MFFFCAAAAAGAAVYLLLTHSPIEDGHKFVWKSDYFCQGLWNVLHQSVAPFLKDAK